MAFQPNPRAVPLIGSQQQGIQQSYVTFYLAMVQNVTTQALNPMRDRSLHPEPSAKEIATLAKAITDEAFAQLGVTVTFNEG